MKRLEKKVRSGVPCCPVEREIYTLEHKPSEKEKICFFSRYRQVDLRIQRRCVELSYWKQRALQLGGDIPMKGCFGSKEFTALEHIALIEEEINKDIDRLVEIRNQIRKAIRSVRDGTLELLLEYRYIDGFTWEELGERLNYTYQWVCVLHKRALARVTLPSFGEEREKAV